jgi:Domain of unknown function (DUF4365)
MITTQHIEEDLSRAYLQAVVARAGAILAVDRGHDYAIDGTIRQVRYVNKKRRESGFHLDFQLKACKNVVLSADEAKYDLDVDTYNYLVERHEIKHTNKVLLILLALPNSEAEWISLSEEQLVLKKCCYWISLAGALSNNKETRRVTIPRSNLLTPEKLVELLNIVEVGGALP